MDAVEVARALRDRRIQLGLTQRQVGRMLNVGYTTISDHETGRKSPLLWTLSRWADALGMQVQVVAAPAGRALQPCGTPAAAKRHYYRKEPLCAPCREGLREFDRERQRSLRRKRAA